MTWPLDVWFRRVERMGEVRREEKGEREQPAEAARRLAKAARERAKHGQSPWWVSE